MNKSGDNFLMEALRKNICEQYLCLTRSNEVATRI